MDLGLRGKRAVVTGGTRGIGRAIAETLAREGAHVAICARNSVEVSETVDALKTLGAKAYGGVVDIADGEGLKTWVADVIGQLGGLDVLVSSASAMTQGDSDEAWLGMFEIDIMGLQRASAVALPYLAVSAAESGDAAIIIISSIAALEASEASAYGPIKAAQIHVAKGLAKQWAKAHVRVNVVSPGAVYFEGGIWHKVEHGDPEFFKIIMARNPMGRMATPQDIANAAVFLASPMSSFTTGINLAVEGGMTSRVSL